MKTSFFLTPDLKERAVEFAYRDVNGNLQPWTNQIDIIEQDPAKGMPNNKQYRSSIRVLIFDLVSPCSLRRSRVILLYEGLPQAPPSLNADPW